MAEEIINKVAESGLITLDLEQFYPKEEIEVFDLKDFLFMGLILKEKDYRGALQNTNWNNYQSKHIAITCTADAIIPVWAYMLAAQNLQPHAASIFFGNKEQATEHLILSSINKADIQQYTDKRVVVKGCGEIAIPPAAYVNITTLLRPVAKSIMYGEPCSTVPVYKKSLIQKAD